jgi:hypothetical protein
MLIHYNPRSHDSAIFALNCTSDMKFVRLNLRAERDRLDAELDARAQADDARAQYLMDIARRQRLAGQARALAEMDQRWRMYADKLVR